MRQGVSEACALALASASPDAVVTLELQQDGPGLTARVWPVPATPDDDGEDLSRAVLSGLTDETGVEERDGHGVLRLSWLGGPLG